MEDQVTSVEQSKRLIELGVPAEKASMVYVNNADIPSFKAELASSGIDLKELIDDGHEYYPAFTVADLLGLLPPKISWQDPSDGNFRMRRYMGENGIEWVVDYDRFIANDVSIINALVETIILLVSTKHELNL